MALPGECVCTGADKPDSEIDIHLSNAGWYIGYWDDEGPVSRESDYYAEYDEAALALHVDGWWDRAGGFNEPRPEHAYREASDG